MIKGILDINEYYYLRAKMLTHLERLKQEDLELADFAIKENPHIKWHPGAPLKKRLYARKQNNGLRLFKSWNGRNGIRKTQYLDTDSEEVTNLATLENAKKLYDDFTGEIDILEGSFAKHERLLNSYQSRKYGLITERLSEYFPSVEAEALSRILSNTHQSQIERAHDIQGWIQRNSEQNPKYPEGKQYKTNAGFMVRSKSEQFTADTLYEWGIPFCYEMALTLNGKTIYPDFVLIRPDGSLIIWEHCGLNDMGYQSAMAFKLNLYPEYGFCEHTNLIVTEENDVKTQSNIERILMRFYFIW